MKKLLKDTEVPEDFAFSTNAKTIDTGLFDDLQKYLDDNPTTGFIIIDTLQLVRDITSNNNAYAKDYKDLRKLKTFADKNNIALLIIHHTRKLQDSDVFNNVSGTNGILGAVDTAIVFSKENREDTKIQMGITGRDVMSETFDIEFNDYAFIMLGKTQTWEEQMADFRYTNDPIVKTIKELLSENENEWRGTATDLQKEIQNHDYGYKDEKDIGRELKKLKEAFFKRDSIIYEYHDINGTRKHCFSMPLESPTTN